LEKKGYIYSSVIADFFELDALGWLERSEEKIEVFDRLERKMQGIKDSALWFFFYFEQISNYAHLLRVNELLKVTQKCRRLIYRLPYSPYWEYFGSILTYVGKYKDACSFYKRASEREKNKVIVERLILKLAISGYGMAGEYPECKKMLSKARATKNRVHLAAINSLANAHLSFGQGNLTEASKFFLEPLKTVSRVKPLNNIYAASIGLASVAMAMNNKSEAKIYLKKYLPLMKKYKHVREELTLGCLLGSVEYISDERLQIPPLYLLNRLLQANRTMRVGDYRKAFNFAQRKGLLGLFHRWIVFLPELVLHILEKGKNTGLPIAILNLPVFNQKIPVYHIKFLGNFVATKNQDYLKARLSPKEKALLIQIALSAGESNKTILVKSLFKNFWSKSANPSSLFSHLLVKLRKKLRLPGYLLVISSRYEEPRLVNRGVYLTTDYNDIGIAFVQAKALERAGEWGCAKKEYLRAFKLFRGEPFCKMYDPWSEHMRRVILNKLETEAFHFAKSCLEHDNEIRQKKRRTPSAKCRGGNMADAKKVLEKVVKIVPQSEESAKILQTL
jgi:tetratricopeptide (TPR) repeat protein